MPRWSRRACFSGGRCAPAKIAHNRPSSTTHTILMHASASIADTSQSTCLERPSGLRFDLRSEADGPAALSPRRGRHKRHPMGGSATEPAERSAVGPAGRLCALRGGASRAALGGGRRSRKADFRDLHGERGHVDEKGEAGRARGPLTRLLCSLAEASPPPPPPALWSLL